MTLKHITTGVFGVLGAVWVGLKLRVMPKSVSKYWFMATGAGTMIGCNIGTFFFDLPRRICFVSPKRTQNWCAIWCCLVFKACTLSNPQVRFYIDESADVKWCDFDHRSAILVNHSSFFDVIAYIGKSPMSLTQHSRVMLKSTLRKMPIFGPVFDRCGHFPVYFKSSEDGAFSVDKERQWPITEKVNAHIDAGNPIIIFPEGQIAKDPTKLQTFRQGTFTTVLEKKLKLYYIIMVNNDKVWPNNGLPTGNAEDVYIKVGSIPVSSADEDGVTLASKSREYMQSVMDEIRSKISSNPPLSTIFVSKNLATA